MKVCAGTRNPAKLAGIREAFEEFFGREVEVYGVGVESGVGDQPWGEEEVWKGALTRAKNAAKECEADFYVGVESGIIERRGRYFVVNAVAVINGSRVFLGMGPWLELHPRLVREIKDRKEMEEVMEELTGVSEIGDKHGAVGVFTRGTMDRPAVTKFGTLAALAGYEQALMLGDWHGD